MDNKYYIVSGDILQDVVKKVVEVKELLHKGIVKDITEGVKAVGISRSAYYKYKDKIFTVSEGIQGQKATVAMLLSHKAGVLSRILDTIAAKGGNVLTISQDLPINNSANVVITLDISSLVVDVKELLEILLREENVLKSTIVAIE
ncbi:ACT domain-containing protein [Alloiococcus sp. CFN-8]|uniref:ACT domain-containing protein n=1 Tax=Alloiococcus sp. CFN-8 TaxID=3416081 RepID=UPI003CF9040B